jgi:hypothetical protein
LGRRPSIFSGMLLMSIIARKNWRGNLQPRVTEDEYDG